VTLGELSRTAHIQQRPRCRQEGLHSHGWGAGRGAGICELGGKGIQRLQADMETRGWGWPSAMAAVLLVCSAAASAEQVEAAFTAAVVHQSRTVWSLTLRGWGEDGMHRFVACRPCWSCVRSRLP
jgi:hypothetical protein